MKVLWNGSSDINTAQRTYKTYDNAVKAAAKIIGDSDQRVIIAATPEGRFFPVAIGYSALDRGIHFNMCVAA